MVKCDSMPAANGQTKTTGLDNLTDGQILSIMEECRTVAAACERLGVHRSTLWARRSRPSYKRLLKERARETAMQVMEQREADVALALAKIRDIIATSPDAHACINACRMLLQIHDNAQVIGVDARADDDTAEDLIRRMLTATASAAPVPVAEAPN